MKMLIDENEDDITKILCIRSADGRPALRIGWLATLFFEEPWTRAVRQAVADAAEAYLQRFGEHLRWTEQPETGRLYPIEARRVPSPGEWLPQHKDGVDWEFGLHGGEHKSDASDFQVSGLGSDEASKIMGFFQVHLPLPWFTEHPGTFPEFVLGLCQRIKPLSGYGGIGVLEPLSVIARARFQPVVRTLAERFPGLEIEDCSGHTLWLKDGIKGVNWLTILGDRWIQAAGGADYLRVRLDENFTFYSYDGGLMIQAGPKPQLGDVQGNRWPQHYVTLAKVLKKIQITNHYPFHLGGPGRMDKEASMAWLFRFDGK
ncbi:type VI immunity family protein [Sorangium sp. So ce1128]